MDRAVSLRVLGFASLSLCLLVGCQSPYYADQGALFGGLLGAGTGAIVGDAVGNAGAGAAIGAGVGAISGAAAGQAMDDIEARNRAQIEAQLAGQRLSAGACTIEDVVMMSQSGVDDQLIINHIRDNGVAQSLGATDLRYLTEQGVSPRVIEAMQNPPARPASQPVVVREPAPAPVIVEEYHYGPPCYHHYPPPRHYYRHRRPGFSWGISVHD